MVDERSRWNCLFVGTVVRVISVFATLAVWFVAGMLDWSDHFDGDGSNWKVSFGWWSSAITMIVVVLSMIPFRGASALAVISMFGAIASFFIVAS